MARHDKEGEKQLLRLQKAYTKGKKSQEELRARKATAKERKALKDKTAPRQRVSEDNWDDLLDKHGRSSKRLVEKKSDIVEVELPPVTEEEFAAAPIVISVSSGRCRVVTQDGSEVDVVVPSEIAVKQKSVLTVGDRIETHEESGVVRLSRVLPRNTVLARPDPLRKHMQRLIAANIDVVVNVVSVKSPPLRPRLIDRYLIAVQRGGAAPVVCVNKIDLVDEEWLALDLEQLEVYRNLGVPIIPCSTKTGEGLEQLRGLVTGKTSALVGHSGVGKSSILNALDSGLQLATADVSKKWGTGRHTTTSSTLIDFGGGTYIIDTPGIREFGLWSLDREALRDYFPEFDEPAEYCRFTNCSHVHEPDCEVQARVDAEELDAGRYETYVRMWEELGEAK